MLCTLSDKRKKRRNEDEPPNSFWHRAPYRFICQFWKVITHLICAYAYTFGSINTNSFFFLAENWNERGRTLWFSFHLCFFSWLFNILSSRSFNFVDISPITSQLKVASGLIFIRTHIWCLSLFHPYSFLLLSPSLPHTHRWWFEWEKKSNLEWYTEIGDGLDHRGNESQTHMHFLVILCFFICK